MLPGMLGMAGFTGEPPSVTLVHTSSSASETAQYGADGAGRWIAILALGGDDISPYSLAATISGVSATVIKRHSSGTGAGTATGTAILVGQPTGSSGTVTITGTSTMRFHVLRVMGYNLGSAVYTNDSDGAGVPPWSVNVPALGLALSINQSSAGVAPLSWTNLTERIADNVLIGTKVNTVAWDLNMAANPTLSVDVTASDTNGATSAVIATFNPS